MATINSKRLATATMMGVAAFLSKAFLPSPIDKMLIMFEALALAMASLMLVKWGAIYASLIDGLLLSVFRAWLLPFSLVFALVFGMLIDGSFQVLKISSSDELKTRRLMLALSTSAAITGLASMIVTTAMGMMPIVPVLYVAILVIGVGNGAVAGYLASMIWNKQIRHRFSSHDVIGPVRQNV